MKKTKDNAKQKIARHDAYLENSATKVLHTCTSQGYCSNFVMKDRVNFVDNMELY
jgi:hypothetical protein